MGDGSSHQASYETQELCHTKQYIARTKHKRGREKDRFRKELPLAMKIHIHHHEEQQTYFCVVLLCTLTSSHCCCACINIRSFLRWHQKFIIEIRSVKKVNIVGGGCELISTLAQQEEAILSRKK